MDLQEMLPVYLDYNATTPYADEVVESIREAMISAWGNPSSSNSLGKKAKALVEDSRLKVANMIDASPSEIIFTSGGTESNNMTIMSVVQFFLCNHATYGFNAGLPHVISTNIEHDSVRLPLENLSNENKIRVTYVAASPNTGQVSPTEIVEALRPETCLVTVMLANNETGIIQPIREIADLLRKTKRRFPAKTLHHFSEISPILFHTDAAQAIGKISVSVKDLDVDFLTIVGHKFYGPRNGALYVKNLLENPEIMSPMLFGGGQERGFRPGTENTALIAGIGKACELVSLHLYDYQSHMERVRNYLEEVLRKQFGDRVVFNNILDNVQRLPNTTSVAFPHEELSGAEILKATPFVIASTGAACHSSQQCSSVLVNSGVSEKLAQKTLRLSVGRGTTEEDIDRAVKELSRSLEMSVNHICCTKINT